jgi:hypothetical protein
VGGRATPQCAQSRHRQPPAPPPPPSYCSPYHSPYPTVLAFCCQMVASTFHFNFLSPRGQVDPAGAVHRRRDAPPNRIALVVPGALVVFVFVVLKLHACPPPLSVLIGHAASFTPY